MTVWRLDKSGAEYVHYQQSHPVMSCAFSEKSGARGINIVAGLDNGTACIEHLQGTTDPNIGPWERFHDIKGLCLQRHSERIVACAFTPDGSRILTCSHDGTAIMSEWLPDKVIFKVEHKDRINDGVFSDDGRTFLTASEDRTVKLWNAQTGAEIRTFKGSTQGVLSCAFAPGRKIVATCADGCIAMWDRESGDRLFTIHTGHGEEYFVDHHDGPRSKRDGVKVVKSADVWRLYRWTVEQDARLLSLPPESVSES